MWPSCLIPKAALLIRNETSSLAVHTSPSRVFGMVVEPPASMWQGAPVARRDDSQSSDCLLQVRRTVRENTVLVKIVGGSLDLRRHPQALELVASSTLKGTAPAVRNVTSAFNPPPCITHRSQQC